MDDAQQSGADSEIQERGSASETTPNEPKKEARQAKIRKETGAGSDCCKERKSGRGKSALSF